MTEGARMTRHRAVSVVGLILVAATSAAALEFLPDPLGVFLVLVLPVIGIVILWFTSTRPVAVLGLVLVAAPLLTLVFEVLNGLSQINN